MAYQMYTWWGDSYDDPDEAQIREILRGLVDADEEHPDVWLEHESAWALSVFVNRMVVWGHLDASDDQRVIMESWDEIVRTLLILARGDIETVQQIIDKQREA